MLLSTRTHKQIVFDVEDGAETFVGSSQEGISLVQWQLLRELLQLSEWCRCLRKVLILVGDEKWPWTIAERRIHRYGDENLCNLRAKRTKVCIQFIR